MARIKIKFVGTPESDTYMKELEVYVLQNEIVVNIDNQLEGNETAIHFDKATAIRLSKELRKQIGVLTEEETMYNG